MTLDAPDVAGVPGSAHRYVTAKIKTAPNATTQTQRELRLMTAIA